MLKDQYGNPIFQEADIIDILYTKDMEILKSIIAEKTEQTELIPNLKYHKSEEQTIEEYDLTNQENWYMPVDYKNLDIVAHVRSVCPPWDPNYTRAEQELELFQSRNMLNLLKWLKYFVSISRENNIVLGVGRGSSVASYVLYLLGVHKIDSIKYNLDYREFFR